jgi:hypothetical protein
MDGPFAPRVLDPILAVDLAAAGAGRHLHLLRATLAGPNGAGGISTTIVAGGDHARTGSIS